MSESTPEDDLTTPATADPAEAGNADSAEPGSAVAAAEAASAPGPDDGGTVVGNEASGLARVAGTGVKVVSETTQAVQHAVHNKVRGVAAGVGDAVPVAKSVVFAVDGVVGIVDSAVAAQHKQVRGTAETITDAAVIGLRAGAPDTALNEKPGAAKTIAVLTAAAGDSMAADADAAAVTAPMGIRVDGARVTAAADQLAESFADASPTVMVFVHGLASTEHWWGEGNAQSVADAGATAVFVRYNTGRAIAANGADLAVLLQSLADNWPVPMTRLILTGHSMGGLVIRAACLVAQAEDMDWLTLLTDVITLGTPHKGSPVEQLADVALRSVAPESVVAPVAELLGKRSRGIKDLRFGAVSEEDWDGRDPDEVATDTTDPQPLPAGVRLHQVVATLAKNPDAPTADVVGDGLVPPGSAGAELGGQSAETLVELPGVGHNGLLDNPDVQELLGAVITGGASADPATGGASTDASPGADQTSV